MIMACNGYAAQILEILDKQPGNSMDVWTLKRWDVENGGLLTFKAKKAGQNIPITNCLVRNFGQHMWTLLSAGNISVTPSHTDKLRQITLTEMGKKALQANRTKLIVLRQLHDRISQERADSEAAWTQWEKDHPKTNLKAEFKQIGYRVESERSAGVNNKHECENPRCKTFKLCFEGLIYKLTDGVFTVKVFEHSRCGYQSIVSINDSIKEVIRTDEEAC